jgi:hypothetical protein
VLAGRFIKLVPLNPEAHGEALYENSHGEGQELLWRYLFDGPYPNRTAFDARLRQMASSRDPLFFSILDQASGNAVGYASYMRIDPLTGVLNRRGFQAALKQELARAERNGSKFTVVYVDVDRLKEYNDTWGHPATDDFLKEFGRLLKRSIRKKDTAARWGGRIRVDSLEYRRGCCPRTSGEPAAGCETITSPWECHHNLWWNRSFS